MRDAVYIQSIGEIRENNVTRTHRYKYVMVSPGPTWSCPNGDVFVIEFSELSPYAMTSPSVVVKMTCIWRKVMRVPVSRRLVLKTS